MDQCLITFPTPWLHMVSEMARVADLSFLDVSLLCVRGR